MCYCQHPSFVLLSCALLSAAPVWARDELQRLVRVSDVAAAAGSSSAEPGSGMSLKSTQPAYQQLQQFLPLLDALVDILQPLKRLYKALKEYLHNHPPAAGEHTTKSIL